MICKEFIELARLMKEKGIEVEKLKIVCLRDKRNPRLINDYEEGWCFDPLLGPPSVNRCYQEGRHINAPVISDILTVAFGERVCRHIDRDCTCGLVERHKKGCPAMTCHHCGLSIDTDLVDRLSGKECKHFHYPENCEQCKRDFMTIIEWRTIALNKWDAEGNNPLHECPKLCLWLCGEIKNLKKV